jgi:polygalacturonase
MKHLTIATIAVLVLSCAEADPYAALYQDVPFDMPHVKQPVIPSKVVDIRDFGGVGDGIALNTKAFADAIATLWQQGGGRIIVPVGVWHTGPITFKSNIELHLEKGALILFTTDKSAYPIVETCFEGLQTRRCMSPINGRNLENIAITGEGSINAQGEAWRPLKRDKVTASQWKEIISKGGVLKNDNYWLPSKSALRGDTLSNLNMNVPAGNLSDADWLAIKDFLRPVMVSFIECKNILLQGVLFENSPCWNIHPVMCENIIVDGIFSRNPSYAQNGDGIDIESCRNVLIINSLFDVGDDALCLKSGKDEDGRQRGVPTENVIIDNCKVFKGHGGFVVGSEMSGGVRNVVVRNCSFVGTDVGLRFKSKRGRGGVVENIFIDNISMTDIVTDSFLFDLFYGGKSASEALADGDDTTPDSATVIPPVTVETPVFRNITVRNLISRNARRAMFFNGLPEMNISGITIENACITASYGATISESQDITLNNVTILSDHSPALLLNNVKNATITNIKTPAFDTPIHTTGIRNANISFTNTVIRNF